MNPRFSWINWNLVLYTDAALCIQVGKPGGSTEAASTGQFGNLYTDTGGRREWRPHVRDAGVRANLEAARALPREATHGRRAATAEVAA